MKISAKLWIGLSVLIILSPLGLILPRYFKSTGAWGEWKGQELQKIAGYIPDGFSRLSKLWKAPISDYAFNGAKENSLKHLTVSYILSAVIGIAVIVVLMLLIGKMLSKKGD